MAASVNDLMLSIAAKAPNADSTRIAVLACLHLADQLRDAGARKSRNCASARTPKSGEYAAMLEQLISSVEELSA